MKKVLLSLLILLFCRLGYSAHILIPMDDTQTNHLKAYGIAYWILEKEVEAEWFLNYRGGSFLIPHLQDFENELVIRNVSYEVISSAQVHEIKTLISSPESNMDIMRLDVAPKIAVYSPPNKQPWDDAVTLVLTYAEIPYDLVFDDEVLTNKLPEYDWLHLHHEDFTGQYGKFYRAFRHQAWYKEQQKTYEASAMKHGFDKVSQLKLGVTKKIRDFCAGGGFLFAMCSATDTYDIALAAEGVDICHEVFDGDASFSDAQERLDYSKTFAFHKFKLYQNPMVYEYSDIDQQYSERGLTEANDFFTLFKFSAKWDPVPTMLTQNHKHVIKGFMGQTTAYKKKLVKPEVIVMGENKVVNEVRYMHGTYGKGTWTFYGGHDPEDYMHHVGEEPTDLNLHPNSPGYRLILNNILFPAAKKKKQKT